MATEILQKGERIDVRVNAEVKALFTRAAELSGTSLSAFILDAARERAVKLIEQNERIVLNNEARDVLLNALSNPPVPAKSLRRAADRYSDN